MNTELIEERISRSLTKLKADKGVVISGGSHAFGYATEESDYDMRVVVFPEIAFFKPNERRSIVGFDPEGMDSRSLFIAGHDAASGRKYDFFVDLFPGFLRQATTGGYFQLYNLVSAKDNSIYMDPRLTSFFNEVHQFVPQKAYELASKSLLRDLAALRRSSYSGVLKDTQRPKKYLQVKVMCDFLSNAIIPDPMQYSTLRVDSMTDATFQALTEESATQLSRVGATTPEITRNEVSAFKEQVMLAINAWYGEEIFPYQK